MKPHARLARIAGWAGVSALTLVMLAVPTLSYIYVKHRVQLGQQIPPPVLSPLPAELHRAFVASARMTSSSFVVLGYHDLVEKLPAKPDDEPAEAQPMKDEPAAANVEPAAEVDPAEAAAEVEPKRVEDNRGRRVSVTARAFSAHLRMLRLAGYESVSARQVADVLTGRAAAPRRAVLISFDGARWRDWSHTDPILKAYGYQAVIFIDPAKVRTKRGTTLSWLALRKMTETGRWSVGVAGTQASVATNAEGSRASALLAHQWLPQHGRAETTAEFTSRVDALLKRQRRATVDNGLPDPTLFSYPFQPRYPLDSAVDVLDELNGTVAANFAGGVLTMSSDESVDDRWIAKRVIPRMEVYSTSTDEILFHRVREASSR